MGNLRLKQTMVNIPSVLVIALLLTFITVLRAGPTQEACEILEEGITDGEGKLIKVGCGDETVTVDLLEGGHQSTMKIIGKNDRILVQVDYDSSSNDMAIYIEGERFDVKDETTIEQEAAKLQELMADPEILFFPKACKLIHDELQLKGWESPSVMFLYSLAIAMDEYQVNMDKRSPAALQKRFWGGPSVDPDTYNYHGQNPKTSCSKNGYKDDSMDDLIEKQCRGVCGQTCENCWTWVCGDCCMHTGCRRHDDFCKDGYWSKDCLTARGVLWDTITNTPLDC